MSWVLIMFLAGPSAGVLDHIHFKTEELCKIAKLKLEKEAHAPYKTIFCTKVK